MILMLSHSHGAVLTRYASKKIAIAAVRNGKTAGTLASGVWANFFHAGQRVTPTISREKTTPRESQSAECVWGQRPKANLKSPARKRMALAGTMKAAPAGAL